MALLRAALPARGLDDDIDFEGTKRACKPCFEAFPNTISS